MLLSLLIATCFVRPLADSKIVGWVIGSIIDLANF